MLKGTREKWIISMWLPLLSVRQRPETASGYRLRRLAQGKTLNAMIDTPSQRFIADAMLGKLVKWLRVMGIDVVYDAAAPNDQLVQAAARERRVLLTRNHRLAWRQENTAPASFLFIESDYYHEQVRQVVEKFGSELAIRLFTRCLRCNTLLQTVTREGIIGEIPAYILASQTTFKHCAACNRVYWAGTHRNRMLQQLEIMLGQAL